MRRELLAGSTLGLPDAEAFASDAAQARLFDPELELVVTRAPGRLDLMGGIADYSGSLVLQWPLREATLVALQIASDRRLLVVSLAPSAGLQDRCFESELDHLFPGGEPLPYEAAREWFARDAARRWAAYLLGAALVLAREKGARLRAGIRALVRSSVPEAKGVASSAALEVAAMQALAAALGLSLDPRELAVLCQTVENRVVGAACGVMDQMTASCGRAHELLELLCQPAELLGTLPLPAELEVVGLDSGVRHAVSGSDYTGVRVGAFMGARILADLVGLRVSCAAPGEPVLVEDPRWRGFLANVTPSEFEAGLAQRLPVTMRGAEFLARHGGTTDTVTRVEPDREYAVRAPTAHPIQESFRVRAFAELLARPVSERGLALLGELMYQSHASYSACGLGSPATDLLVSLLREAGPARGFFGAKITGGGCGGTVAVLARRGADLRPIAEAYAARGGHWPQVFSGSSPGSSAFGLLRLGPALGR